MARTKILPICIVCLLLGGCYTDTKKAGSINTEIDVSTLPRHSYSEVSEFRICWNDVFEVPVENYYVYFYSKTCSHCENIKDFVIDKALKFRCIYFVESSEDDVIENPRKSSINSTSAEIFSIPGYPTMIEINNKKLIQKVSGEVDIKIVLNFMN